MNDGTWTAANPALGIRRHKTYSRERVMDHRELAALLNGLPMLNQKYQAWFTCRLLVPCRIKELCQMRRDDVSPYGKWTKRTTKNGRPHTVHVPQQALERLQSLPDEGPYFFMGQYGHPLTEGAVRKIWTRWRAELGLQDLWLLDYRRTLATYLYRVMKVDDLTAKAILNHYDSRPVAIYTRLDYEYLATIIQGYADWIMKRL
jgi:integrase